MFYSQVTEAENPTQKDYAKRNNYWLIQLNGPPAARDSSALVRLD
jgi:hypothetical protein